MKYICSKCKNDPCILEVADGIESPCDCPYVGEKRVDWKEFKEEKESYKDRIKRRMTELNEGPGKERFVICCDCKNNDETCSLCVSCISGINFEPKSNENDNCACDCDSCQDRFIQDRAFAETACPTAKKGQVERDYKEDSIVSSRKSEVESLVNAHWSYVEKVIRSGADTKRTFSFDEVMAMRAWDYTSAAIHFYGHGFEDGSNKFAEKTLNRLKEA